jgi:hypothetical protein
MIELIKVERENKVYVNDKVIILDRESITPSKLLELAGFSSLVYDCYLIQNIDGKGKKKVTAKNKPLNENRNKILKTGMQFNAVLKQ